MNLHIRSFIPRFLLVFFLFCGMTLLNVTPASAGTPPPQETLRFFPKQPIAILHVNDLNRSVNKILQVMSQLGFGHMLHSQTKRLWKRYHREAQTRSVPGSWGELFKQMGLPAHPSVSVAFFRDRTSPWKDRGLRLGMLAVIPIHQSNAFLNMFGSIANRTARASFRNCFMTCQTTVSQLRLLGNQQITPKLFLNTAKQFAKTCPELAKHFAQTGQVDCFPNPKARRQFVRRIAHSPVSKAFGKATIYSFRSIPLFLGVTGSFAVLSPSKSTLKQAMQRYQRQATHPSAATFAKRNRDTTHFQALLSQSGYRTLTRWSRQTNRQRQAMNLFPALRVLMGMQKQVGSYRGIKNSWLELTTTSSGFHMYGTSFINKRNASPLIKLSASIPAGPHKTLQYIPKRAFFVASMNTLKAYKTMAKSMLRTLSRNRNNPIQSMLKPWLTAMGSEVSLGLLSDGKQPVQLVLALQLQKAGGLSQNINRLLMMVASRRAVLKTTRMKGTRVHFLFNKARGPRRLPIPTSQEVAYGITNNTLLLTVALTNKPNLSLMQDVLSTSKQPGLSIASAPAFTAFLKRNGHANALAFLSFPTLLRSVKRFLPPIARIRRIFQKLTILRLATLHTKGRTTQDATDTNATLRLNPSR